MTTLKAFSMQQDFWLSEEIARSHQTVDNDPVQYEDHPEVDVEMYANDRGKWSVKVSCVSDSTMNFPMRTFDLESEAEHYARDCCDRIIRSKLNEVRRLVRSILLSNIK